MGDPKPPVLVSACLLGVSCRYDGRSAALASLAGLVDGRAVLAVCPEELGGLGTPRPKACLSGGDGAAVLDGAARVVTESGEDVTAAFRRGAERALDLARAAGVEEAVLKERSPSCGASRIHREGELADGAGVTAALLARAGIRVRGAG
jgi:uncharacterized protein YbbK (DUF523 family)